MREIITLRPSWHPPGCRCGYCCTTCHAVFPVASLAVDCKAKGCPVREPVMVRRPY